MLAEHRGQAPGNRVAPWRADLRTVPRQPAQGTGVSLRAGLCPEGWVSGVRPSCSRSGCRSAGGGGTPSAPAARPGSAWAVPAAGPRLSLLRGHLLPPRGAAGTRPRLSPSCPRARRGRPHAWTGAQEGATGPGGVGMRLPRCHHPAVTAEQSTGTASAPGQGRSPCPQTPQQRGSRTPG